MSARAERRRQEKAAKKAERAKAAPLPSYPAITSQDLREYAEFKRWSCMPFYQKWRDERPDCPAFLLDISVDLMWEYGTTANMPASDMVASEFEARRRYLEPSPDPEHTPTLTPAQYETAVAFILAEEAVVLADDGTDDEPGKVFKLHPRLGSPPQTTEQDGLRMR